MSRTVLVFEEEAILAAAGQAGRRPRIRQAERVELSGFGDPFSRWREGLRALKGKMNLSQVRVVLPASMCSVRMIDIPRMKGRRQEDMARREMEEAFRSAAMDYSVMGFSGRRMSLCCGSAEEKVLAQFLEMLKDLEIGAAGVTVPMEGYLRIIAGVPEYRAKTAVFLFFEENSVTSVLAQNGKYLYSARNRLFSERGTNDFGTEISRNISGILQFLSANKIEASPTDIYYAGCTEDDFEVGLEGLSGMGLSAHVLNPGRVIRFPAGAAASDFMACAGAMMAGMYGARDICIRPAETGKKGFGVLDAFLLPAGILAICLAASGGIALVRYTVQLEERALLGWMQSRIVQQEYAEATAYLEGSARAADAVKALEYAEKNLDTYPPMNQRVIDRIGRAGGKDIDITVHSYDSGTGALNFEAASREVIAIPEYVGKLKATGLFHDVDYTGYAFGDGSYRLMLSCTLEGIDVGGGAK